MEALSPLGYQALPIAGEGDCGIDGMAFWDGKESNSALEASAEDSTWRSILEACGEGLGNVAYVLG